MNEWDALFEAVWNGDEAAMSAFTDRLLEEAASGTVTTERRYYNSDDEQRAAELTVYVPAGLPDTLGAAFHEFSMGLQSRKHFNREQFATEFPVWLDEQIEWLYYVLSK